MRSTAVRGRRRHLLAVTLLAAGLPACTREPLSWICPAIAEGDLVVTELRGAQSGSDTYGQWVELYNASPAAVNLEGLLLSFLRIDGGAEDTILVRAPDVTVAAGEYVVLGRVTPDMVPAHMDYGYLPDFDSNLYSSGAVDVEACGQRIDRVIYEGLPSRGTLSLDGAIDPPTAASNDDSAGWCPDTTEVPSPTELGVPGTPGEPNRPCN